MLVLASASPRRRELLTQAGFVFEVHPSRIPEDPHPNEDPTTYVTRLAREKAESVYYQLTHSSEDSAPASALCQGTTLVVSHQPQNKTRALQAAEELISERGGGFNPRIKPAKLTWASAPEGSPSDPLNPGAPGPDFRTWESTNPSPQPGAPSISRSLRNGWESTNLNPQSLVVLGADTTVTLDDQVLGKPENPADAARMLRLLSGRTHRVITGVAVITSAHTEVASESTTVQFLALSDEDINAYIATGEPMDKAGAYAIQGRAARWIPRIEGDYFNVMGLPISLVSRLLESLLPLAR